MFRATAFAFAAGILAACTGVAPSWAVPIDAEARRAVVDELARTLSTVYVFPDVGAKYAETIQAASARGDYDALGDDTAFADRLTQDLHAVQLDKHLRVITSRDPRAERFRRPAPAAGEADPRAAFLERERSGNYGFAKVEILPGNVGVIDLRSFVPAEIAGETAAAAMGLVANAEAIVFDLRKNGGGSPSMIQLLTSYLYDASDPRHLNSFYVREGDETLQFHTLPYVPGQRLPEIDVFVLTSGNTFSAAEEFTYNLKNMQRATIVGEKTGGGAHPVRPAELGAGLLVTVPFGRAINPITGTNWEGTGIEPDIACAADAALDAAYAEALKRAAERAPNEARKQELLWTMEEAKARTQNVAPASKELRALAGDYGIRTISLEGSRLFMTRENGPKHALVPLGGDVFAIDGGPVPTRVTFHRGKSGRADEMVLSTPTGEIGRSARTS